MIMFNLYVLLCIQVYWKAHVQVYEEDKLFEVHVYLYTYFARKPFISSKYLIELMKLL